MRQQYEQVVLVTGASSGIGAAIAGRLARDGARVYGTSRSDAANLPAGVHPLTMDVTLDESVRSGIEFVTSTEQRLDVVVNNTGTTLLGAVEETSSVEALALLNTNLVGVHRVTQAALPHLRRAQGLCVIVGSIAGFLPKPYEAFYCASKHALEAYAEVLRLEVAPFGVRVVLLQPGYIKTALASNAARTTARMAEYETPREKAAALLADDVRNGSSAERVADAVAHILTRARPRLRHLVGPDARRLRLLKSALPGRMFDWGLRRRFR